MNYARGLMIEQLLNELQDTQQKKLIAYAQRIVPGVTTDDLLQPCDFPQLEHHPDFRYEEGVLHGIQMVQIAIKASQRQYRA